MRPGVRPDLSPARREQCWDSSKTSPRGCGTLSNFGGVRDAHGESGVPGAFQYRGPRGDSARGVIGGSALARCLFSFWMVSFMNCAGSAAARSTRERRESAFLADTHTHTHARAHTHTERESQRASERQRAYTVAGDRVAHPERCLSVPQARLPAPGPDAAPVILQVSVSHIGGEVPPAGAANRPVGESNARRRDDPSGDEPRGPPVRPTRRGCPTRRPVRTPSTSTRSSSRAHHRSRQGRSAGWRVAVGARRVRCSRG